MRHGRRAPIVSPMDMGTIALVLATILGTGGATSFYRARTEKRKLVAESEKTEAEKRTVDVGAAVDTAERLTNIASSLVLPLQAQIVEQNIELGDLRERLGASDQRVSVAEAAARKYRENEEVLSAEITLLKATGESDAIMRSMLNAAPDAMLLVNQHGVVELANRRAEELFRVGQGAMKGLPLNELIPPRFHDRHNVHRDNYVKNPHTRPMGLDLDLWGLRGDGTEFRVEIGLSPFGEGHKVVATVRDMTDRLPKH